MTPFPSLHLFTRNLGIFFNLSQFILRFFQRLLGIFLSLYLFLAREILECLSFFPFLQLCKNPRSTRTILVFQRDTEIISSRAAHAIIMRNTVPRSQSRAIILSRGDERGRGRGETTSRSIRCILLLHSRLATHRNTHS